MSHELSEKKYYFMIFRANFKTIRTGFHKMTGSEIFCKNCPIVVLKHVDERATGSKHRILATAIRRRAF
jgi:CRISPR/Cas system Type II protein with McrA/HNH and RuvC-like nuclease domain